MTLPRQTGRFDTVDFLAQGERKPLASEVTGGFWADSALISAYQRRHSTGRRFIRAANAVEFHCSASPIP